ncbi:cytochrome oxidase [Blattabacterium cuenoti]|uniref:cytochrome oxidase n=1 Tax=Blattabacterium cuenoti TaxID=1653831 RepID=UPI001EEA51F1|nr:cytochrome oxidase [Blattabacterium cuenoti]
MRFFKNYFIREKNIGIFQSIILIIFFLIFSFILFIVFSKPKDFYKNDSLMATDNNKEKK